MGAVVGAFGSNQYAVANDDQAAQAVIGGEFHYLVLQIILDEYVDGFVSSFLVGICPDSVGVAIFVVVLSICRVASAAVGVGIYHTR